MNTIKSLNWIITNRCNSRCSHCAIWKEKKRSETSLSEVKRILSDPMIKRSYLAKHGLDIALGGGEPFLHPDLPKIIREIQKTYPGALKTISTNGILTDKICDFVKNSLDKNIKLNISIDGPKDIHDKIRGIKGGFDAALKTILKIRSISLYQKIEIKLTILPENYGQITKVFALAERLKCDFSFKPAENMRQYTNKDRDLAINFDTSQLCSIRNQAFIISDSMKKRADYKKAVFFKDIPFYLFSKSRAVICSVLREHLTVMPDGVVFDCIKSQPLGNIHSADLKRLVYNSITPDDCGSCMLMCGAFKDYKEHYVAAKVANIEITNRCNLRCSMCTQKELRRSSNKDLGLKQFISVIETYSDIRHVSFVGGESFLNKDLFAMMDHLDGKKITYEITTNGTLVTKKIIGQLKQLAGLTNISFSVDGMKKYHDKERGKGVYSKCLKSLKQCLSNFTVSVSSVVQNDNLEELAKLTDALKKIGLKRHKLILGMDFNNSQKHSSLVKIPTLMIQGPVLKNYLKDIDLFIDLYIRLSKQHGKAVNIKTEPLIHDNRAECKQLKQYRFDPSGKRIFCEFIRNTTNDNRIPVSYLKMAALAICEKCCKRQ